MCVFTTLHKNIPFIIFTNLSCFLAWFFFSFVNRLKESVFLHIVWAYLLVLYSGAFFFFYFRILSLQCFFPSSRAADQASLHPLFLFWCSLNALIKISDTAHYALTSSRLENAWRYFCARTASSTYFHISAVELSLTFPDFLFLLALMTRTMVVRVYAHARMSSE